MSVQTVVVSDVSRKCLGVYNIHLQCSLVTGKVKVRLHLQFLMKCIHLILWNDLAGARVISLPEIVNELEVCLRSDEDQVVFPVCVL